jgi:hypothetical protein
MNEPLAAKDDVIFGNPAAHAVTLMPVPGLSARGYPGGQRDFR